MFLLGEIYQPKLPKGSGGTEPAKVRVKMVEVSRSREGFFTETERTEGSVTRKPS